MQGQSDLGRLLQQIDSEWSSAFQTMHGLSQMASHTFIEARYNRIGELQSEISQIVGEDKAAEMIIERLDRQ